MMATRLSQSLTAQINAAERQVLNRQQHVRIRTATLARKIHRQMTAPATLLLAAGMGFIIGELTKHSHPKSHGANDKPQVESSPLRIALNLITSARTLYTALPLVWMMKPYFQSAVPSQTPEWQSHRSATPDATDVRRKSSRRLR